MPKIDYEQIAMTICTTRRNVVGASDRDIVDQVAYDLAEEFARTQDQFDLERFLARCHFGLVNAD